MGNCESELNTKAISPPTPQNYNKTNQINNKKQYQILLHIKI